MSIGDDQQDSAVIFENRGPIGVITLNRPHVMNAVNAELSAAAGGVIRLQRQTPLKIALEIALTGEPITAARGPVAVRQSKRVIHRTAGMGSDWEPEVWRINKEAANVVFSNADATEGPRAFVEGRAPSWSDR